MIASVNFSVHVGLSYGAACIWLPNTASMRAQVYDETTAWDAHPIMEFLQAHGYIPGAPQGVIDACEPDAESAEERELPSYPIETPALPGVTEPLVNTQRQALDITSLLHLFAVRV